jgi:hypothetical protein
MYDKSAHRYAKKNPPPETRNKHELQRKMTMEYDKKIECNASTHQPDELNLRAHHQPCSQLFMCPTNRSTPTCTLVSLAASFSARIACTTDSLRALSAPISSPLMR